VTPTAARRGFTREEDLHGAGGERIEKIYHLNVEYDLELNEIVISASEQMLKHLQALIQDLIDNKTSGRHYHLDKSSGLEGNVDVLIIQRT
jgi:hypothetical protein